MRDAGRGCLPDPARKAHWIAMTSNPSGDGFTRGFDQVPPEAYEPDPALAGYPPPQPTQLGPASYSPTAPQQRHPSEYPPPPPYPQIRPVPALADRPPPSHQIVRAPLFCWWKPPLCLLLVILLAFVMMCLAIVPVLIAVWITG